MASNEVVIIESSHGPGIQSGPEAVYTLSSSSSTASNLKLEIGSHGFLGLSYTCFSRLIEYYWPDRSKESNIELFKVAQKACSVTCTCPSRTHFRNSPGFASFFTFAPLTMESQTSHNEDSHILEVH